MEIIIKPKSRWSLFDWRELWQYKELLYFFAWRDLKVRYKQTMIGVAWVVFQPLFSMGIFTIFFNKLAGIQADNAPYPIFVFTGLIFWQFFSTSLSDISDCLVQNKNIITKVYFPRVLLPISMVITRLIDFIVASGLFALMLVYYGYGAKLLNFWIIPILCLFTGMFALGLGLILTSINVKYRDVRYVLPFFIQMLLFVTPVIYSASLTGSYSKILALNPMTGVIKAARSMFLGDFPMNWLQLSLSGVACLVFLLIGLIYFHRVERYSADIA